MRPPCPARRERPATADGHQRFAVVVDVDAHPMVELVAARALLILSEELRNEGIVARHMSVALDGCG